MLLPLLQPDKTIQRLNKSFFRLKRACSRGLLSSRNINIFGMKVWMSFFGCIDQAKQHYNCISQAGKIVKHNIPTIATKNATVVRRIIAVLLSAIIRRVSEAAIPKLHKWSNTQWEWTELQIWTTFNALTWTQKKLTLCSFATVLMMQSKKKFSKF